MRTDFFLVCLVGAAIAQMGCQSRRHVQSGSVPRQAVITDIKHLEESLGFEPTGNFLDHSHDTEAFYRCYYTGKFELSDSYEGLRMKDGGPAGCDVDERKYDVFFYAMEAVASGKTPVTASLSQASMERLAVVVPHEDFHNQPSLRGLPETMREAAATLVGFLTAARFAEEKFGAASEQYLRLAREADLFLRKSRLVNEYHGEAKVLYATLRERQITETEALEQKSNLFRRLAQACTAIEPAPATFNRCPPVLNNAALAFDRTYTKHYRLVYELFVDQGRDLRATIEVLTSLAGDAKMSEREAEREIRKIIAPDE